MTQGAYVTLVGFVAREPVERRTKSGTPVADLRIGATMRTYDRTTQEWRDGETSYYTVNCWRRLSGHVRASLRKGDPVLVKGQLRTRSYQDKQGKVRTEIEINADTVGHDLSQGVANYQRPVRTNPKTGSEDAESAMTGGEHPGTGAGGEHPDADMGREHAGTDAGGEYADAGVGGEQAAAGAYRSAADTQASPETAAGTAAADPTADLGADVEIDEDAVQQFNRELDHGLAEGGPMARELAEPEEPAGVPAPF